jgi:hypothetical protein
LPLLCNFKTWSLAYLYFYKKRRGRGGVLCKQLIRREKTMRHEKKVCGREG